MERPTDSGTREVPMGENYIVESPNNNSSNLGITVESASDSEEVESVNEDEEECSPAARRPAQVPACLPNEISTSLNQPPVFGSVSVSHSSEVHFGNKTIINGPVTIKQLGVDNNGFINSEEYIPPIDLSNVDAKYSRTPENDQSKWILRPHYILMGLVGIAVMVSVTTLVTIFVEKSQNDSASATLPEMNAKPQVVAILSTCVDPTNFLVLWMGIHLLMLVSALIGIVLTKNHSTEADDLTPVNKKRTSNSHSGDLLPASRLRYVSRTEWIAQPVVAPLDPLTVPAPWVIIAHTATESCSIQSECVLVVRHIQMFHIESRHWYDIGYNFLVGGDGSAYVGRGWDSVGSHTKYYNSRSIGIAFIGTFNNIDPPKRQVAACMQLIEDGIALGKIAKDYKLFGHRQLMSSLSPGDRVYSIIKQWPHWTQNNTDDEPSSLG